MGPERGPLCLLFYYQLQGEAQGSLRVLLRDSDQEETLLWALKGDQGPHWREGRTILPQSPREYQVSVVFEGTAEKQFTSVSLHLHCDREVNTTRLFVPPTLVQVVFEGFFDHPTRGHIRIDNIHMSNSMELEQCTRKSHSLCVYPSDHLLTSHQPVCLSI